MSSAKSRPSCLGLNVLKVHGVKNKKEQKSNIKSPFSESAPLCAVHHIVHLILKIFWSRDNDNCKITISKECVYVIIYWKPIIVVAKSNALTFSCKTS